MTSLACPAGLASSPGLLLPHHVAQLALESGITPEVIAESGAYSITRPDELLELGFKDYQATNVPGILFPYDTFGCETRARYRPDTPRLAADGKPIKYEQPADEPMALYVPPSVREVLPDPAVDLLLVEGEKKTLAGASRGLACVGLFGVWCWRGTNEFGGTAALGDFDSIPFSGRLNRDGRRAGRFRRKVYICFDSDVMTKPEVQRALVRFKAFLESRGAEVWIIYLPDGPNGEKVGLDDYLLDHAPAELLALATRDLVEAPVTDWQGALAEKDAQTVIAAQAEVINRQRAELDLAAEIARENAAALGLVRAVLGDPDKKMGAKAAFLSVWLEGNANPDRKWDYQEELAKKVGLKPETFRHHIRPFTTDEGPVVKVKGGEWVEDPEAPRGRRWVERVRYDLRFTDNVETLSAYLTVAKPEPKPTKPKESCLHLVTRTTQIERQLCTSCDEVLTERTIEPAARQTIFSCVGDHLEPPPPDSPSPPCPLTIHAKKSRVGALVDAPAAIGDLMRRHQPRHCGYCQGPIAASRPASDYCSDCALAAPVEALV